MGYQELGLKCGTEIHQQLEGKKLFCNCLTKLRDDKPDFEIRRKLRAVAGEHGEIDVAALQEQLRERTFVYQGYNDTTCLVETDSEPPHELNKDALYTTLQFCKLVRAKVSPVVQVMRKTVVDGSNTSGFQRTALIARGGEVETSEGKVRIENISLEEDACRIIAEKDGEKVYRLDRLGIPLIEIGTAPDIKSPEQCQEAAKKLGMLLRSLPGVKRGLGTIRQDVNVSIAKGSRIEIKGAQDLRQLPLLVELEVKRQVELLKLKKFLNELTKDFLKEYPKNPAKHFFVKESNFNLLTNIFKDTKNKLIKKKIENKKEDYNVAGFRLPKFKGIIGKEIQPGKRIGSELSDYAKVKTGIGGIIHSDEDLKKKYQISEEEIKTIKKKLNIKDRDAFVLIVVKGTGNNAFESICERLEMFSKGVPKEVRKANPDGTSSFLRPMPGAARMYPETDVPLVRPDVRKVELPELLEDKIARFQKKFGLSKDLAEFIAKSDKVRLFEELVSKYKQIKPAFIAETLTSRLLDIKRQYKEDPNKLTDENFRQLFQYLAKDKIHKDIVLDVLIDMIKGKFDLKYYSTLGTEELIHKELKEIVEQNPGAPFPALMGIAMKKLRGKASGKFISEHLKKILEEGHK